MKTNMGFCAFLPDEHRGVQQAYDGCDVDAHQHFAINVLQAEVAVLHLTVRHIIMEDELHLQEPYGGHRHVAFLHVRIYKRTSPSFSSHSPM